MWVTFYLIGEGPSTGASSVLCVLQPSSAYYITRL